MNNRVNYTFVGLLVIVGFTMIMIFSYWLLKPEQEKETKKYLIRFDESVLGLNVDSSECRYKALNSSPPQPQQVN